MFERYSTIVLLIGLLQCAHALRVNLTMFTNCRDLDIEYGEADVAITKVSYDRDADGICNTIHVEYHVKKPSDKVQAELVIGTYKCPPGTTTICLDNAREHVEDMTCERFHTDDSGPWYMLSSAMSNGDRCGRVEGFYNLDAAVLDIKYLRSYLDVGKGSYRVRMLFHVPGTDLTQKNVRGCCEMDFDVID
ncbi:uncharacterized protein LOC129762540 [Toxorhynchites rutilus septentrionalis]|uniref:uncharacterized protein LOC129762540 n=1 Tax=Toxorhynchites rutilus septentrionalis TaxID=329112 RepID=UPI00247A5D05|nr:uncharacterized protein LOC129762540 [Toxorhynchites rutilus septentrionalis]